MRQCDSCGAYLDPEERCDCQAQKVLDKDIVRVMNAVFSGYDQPMHSKVKQPDKYGIMRIPRAEKILNLAFPKEPTRRAVRENRKLGNKHTFRLDDAEERRLQAAMERMGIEPTSLAWKAKALPLDDTRIHIYYNNMLHLIMF